VIGTTKEQCKQVCIKYDTGFVKIETICIIGLSAKLQITDTDAYRVVQ